MKRPISEHPGPVISGKILLVEPADTEAEQTERWTVPQEIESDLRPAPVVKAHTQAPDRHTCKTLASPIPAMLAETMDLAQDRDPPGQKDILAAPLTAGPNE